MIIISIFKSLLSKLTCNTAMLTLTTTEYMFICLSAWNRNKIAFKYEAHCSFRVYTFKVSYITLTVINLKIKDLIT